MPNQVQREAANALTAERELDDRVRPTPDVDGRVCERFVHRNAGVAEPANACAIPESLRERRAQHQRDVLDRVVLVDFEVARCPNRQIEQGVMPEAREDVVVEPDARLDRYLAGAVEAEVHAHVGLPRPSCDGGLPWGVGRRDSVAVPHAFSPKRRPIAAACAASPSAIASVVTVSRIELNPARSMRWTWTNFPKASTPSGPDDLASPPVGST